MSESDTLLGIADLFLTVYPRFGPLLMAQLDPADDELTISHIRALSKLVDKPITVGELAERLNMTRQGASLQAQFLVEHGWICRIPDPQDRRSALLKVTDKGYAQFLEARRTRMEYIASVFERLTPEELAAFKTTLLALQRVLD